MPSGIVKVSFIEMKEDDQDIELTLGVRFLIRELYHLSITVGNPTLRHLQLMWIQISWHVCGLGGFISGCKQPEFAVG